MSSSNNVSSAPLDFSAAELVPGRKAISKTGDQQGLTLLPAEFVPGETDVICQRGKDSFEHVGNKRFRELIDEHINDYFDATSRQAKSTIVANIYDRIRKNAKKPSSGFVRKDLLTRRWFLVSEKEARDKVGQALRDAIKIIRSAASRLSNPDKVASTPSGKRSSSGGNVGRPQSSETSRDRDDGDFDDRPRLSHPGAPQRPASTDVDSSCGPRHAMQDRSTQHLMASRLLENQALALGPFPLSSGNLNAGNFDDLDGLGMTTMLETSIEPIDKRTGKKRRLDGGESSGYPSLNAFGFASDSLQNPFGLGQDFIQAAKRNMQLPMVTGNSLDMEQRLPVSGRDDWQMRLNQQFPSNFGAQPSASNLPFYLMQQGAFNVEQSSQKKQGTGGQSDLEPTPLLFGGQRGNTDQRASALAQLLWPDESQS